MKANELRIGNLVILNNPKYHPESIGKIFMIDSVKSDDVSLFDYKNLPSIILYQYLKYIEPIPLTEEWLLKFGFEKDDNDEYYDVLWYYGSFEILKSINEEIIYPVLVRDGNHYDYKSGVIIKYVHQLQNLYFALTGEELRINNNNKE